MVQFQEHWFVAYMADGPNSNQRQMPQPATSSGFFEWRVWHQTWPYRSSGNIACLQAIKFSKKLLCKSPKSCRNSVHQHAILSWRSDHYAKRPPSITALWLFKCTLQKYTPQDISEAGCPIEGYVSIAWLAYNSLKVPAPVPSNQWWSSISTRRDISIPNRPAMGWH